MIANLCHAMAVWPTITSFMNLAENTPRASSKKDKVPLNKSMQTLLIMHNTTKPQ